MMAATRNLCSFLLLILPALVLCDTCLEPKVDFQSYTTPETVLSSDTIFIVQFKLTCKNKDLTNINLYADINGKTLAASHGSETNSYQISLSDEHKNLPAGTYPVRLYDEDSYAALRKAQRSGENTDSIKPLYTINLKHKGLWMGPYVQTEFVATCVAVLVWYLAYHARSKLQSN